MTDLLVSIVSYNTRDLLRCCLKAVLRDSEELALRVIVVDNASRDDSPCMVRSEFPQVTLIANEVNLGFAAANNQALAQATGRYFLLLNSDTEVSQGALARLVHFMDETPDCGVCCPQLLCPDGRLQISHMPFRTPRDRASWEIAPRMRELRSVFASGAGVVFEKQEASTPRVDGPVEIERPRGACFMIRMACVEEIGKLDEHYFMYCEEVDWALRARNAGWKNYFVPDAKVIHVWGASTALRSSLMKDIQTQSDYYYYRKHFGFLGWLTVRLAHLVGAALALLLATCALLPRRWSHHNLVASEQLSALRALLRRALMVRKIRPRD